MSGFDLVPVDGGDRVHVPPGETQLGRGPFLGVSDKRVSRHHALLDNQSRRLRLKPDVGAGDRDEEQEQERGGVATHPASTDTEQQRATERVASASGPTPRLRTPCPYRGDCYRKNPLHFQECSHPGDTDYEEEEEEDEENRPECPYGTDCYRKNPLHRKEYKHTRRPARSTRAAPKKATGGDDEEEEEQDSGDDSFINDDSEDGGGDSDYVPPPDSDEGGGEDVATLRREAKDFLRRGK